MEFRMIKHFLFACLIISMPSYSMHSKRKHEFFKLDYDGKKPVKVNRSNNYYKAQLQKALLECIAVCNTFPAEVNINHYGYNDLKQILKNISGPQCSLDTVQNERLEFLNLIVRIKRTENPSVYEDAQLMESLDEADVAFYKLAEQKEKARKRNLSVT